MPNLKANGIAIEYEATGPADGVPLLIVSGYADK